MAVGEPPVKQAIQWISDQRKENSKVSMVALIDDACKIFNLSPLDSEFLWRQLASPSA